MQRSHLNTTGNTEQTEQETPLNHCHVSPAPTELNMANANANANARNADATRRVVIGNSNSVTWCEAENRTVCGPAQRPLL